MSERKEFSVPSRFPVRGLVAFANMLPDDMAAVKETLFTLANGIELDVLKLVASINEEVKSWQQEESSEDFEIVDDEAEE